MTGRRRVVYDTRFIAAMYSPKDDDESQKIRHEVTSTLSRYLSSLTIYEVYKISLETEDKQTAETRVELLRQDFTLVDVDWNLAKQGAIVWKKYHIPMADAIIAATAMRLKAQCVTNDEHISKISEIKSRWV